MPQSNLEPGHSAQELIPARFSQPSQPTQGRRYLLPCTYLDYGGLYEYVLIDVPQARQWLLAGPVQGFISHPLLFNALLKLIGFMLPPPERGPLPSLSCHDDALCFVVAQYETLALLSKGNSRQIQRLVEEHRYTLGLLRRLC